jgi:hypothetical protein
MEAKVALFVAARAPAEPTEVDPHQVVKVVGGNGTFELSCVITTPGDPHVSFYPARDGESFGGVYFAVAESKS